jgi:hypothetical protein
MATFERVIPLLTYQDISAAHDFLVHAFGFASGGVHRTPDGQAVHGEVRAGDVAIWLHRVTAEHDLDSPRGIDVANSGLVVQECSRPEHASGEWRLGGHDEIAGGPAEGNAMNALCDAPLPHLTVESRKQARIGSDGHRL